MTAVRRRIVFVGAILFCVALCYTLALILLRPFVAGSEQSFAAGESPGARPLDLYVDVLAIDPVRQSMDVRLDVVTGPGRHGTRYDGALRRDIELRVGDGESERNFRIRRDASLTPHLVSIVLDGALVRYPFDRYAGRIVLAADEFAPNGGRTTVPVRATVWNGAAGWSTRVTTAPLSGAPRELGLAVVAARPGSSAFFACVLYGIMVAIAASALAFGSLVFIGKRRVEVTLVGALAAMVFSLPVLRNVLPGAPPLGILADILVLLWAEIAVAIGLLLLVTAWIRRGPAP